MKLEYLLGLGALAFVLFGRTSNAIGQQTDLSSPSPTPSTSPSIVDVASQAAQVQDYTFSTYSDITRAIKSAESQKSSIGRQLAAYQQGYKEEFGTLSGYTQTDQYTSLADAFGSLKSQIAEWKPIQRELYRAKQQF